MKKDENNELEHFLDNLDEFYAYENDADGNKKENMQNKTIQEINGNSYDYSNDSGDYEYYTNYYDPSSITEVSRKCECGSDSTGLIRHSNWCPKFESWMEK